jgi:hypothetical protein
MGLTKKLLALLVLLPLACGPGTVEIRATQTCEGGNVDDCKKRCDTNQGVGCYKLGWLHEKGQIVDHNFEEALRLYEKACDQSWAVACRALGDLYWRGEKVERDYKKAMRYWTKACGLGLAIACPTQLEQDVADGRLLAKQKPDGGFTVAPSPTYRASAPSAPNASAPNAPAVSAPSAPQPTAPSVPQPAAPSAPQPAAPSVPQPSMPKPPSF